VSSGARPVPWRFEGQDGSRRGRDGRTAGGTKGRLYRSRRESLEKNRCGAHSSASAPAAGVGVVNRVGSGRSPLRGLKLLNPSRVTAKVDPVDPVDPGPRPRTALVPPLADAACVGEWGSVLAGVLAHKQRQRPTKPAPLRHRRGRTAPETQPRRSLAGPWWEREDLRGAAVTMSERASLSMLPSFNFDKAMSRAGY
jgi:hypothetical protein